MDQTSEKSGIEPIDVEKKINLDERNQIICFINDHIDEIPINDRREILSMLMMGAQDPNKFVHKGTGTQIAYKFIPNNQLIWIHNKINNKIN